VLVATAPFEFLAAPARLVAANLGHTESVSAILPLGQEQRLAISLD
jgi:hypothetical protein